MEVEFSHKSQREEESMEKEIEKGNGGKVIKAKEAVQHWELITSTESTSLEHCYGQRGNAAGN